MFKTVSAKLTASAATAVLIVLVLTAMNLLTQKALLRRTDSIAQAVEAVRQATGVSASLARARRHEQEAIVALVHQDLMDMKASQWADAMKDTLQSLAALRQGVEGEAAVGALAAAHKDLQAYEAGFKETLAAVKKGLVADSSIAEGTMTEARAQADTAETQLGKAAQSLVELSDQARAEMAVAAEQARTVSLVLLAVFAGVGLVGSALIRRAIIRPLDDAIVIARRVAAGDLSNAATHPRKDEFGLLFEALCDMRMHLQELVSGVRSSVESVACAATEIASGNLDLSTRTELQAANLQQASHSVHRISESLVSSAQTAQAVSSSAEAMYAAAQSDGERVMQVVETMRAIHATTQQIQAIAGIIDGLALQTHILGLNASIEASNAGERGRGFSVVASGVRDLAERCRTATGEVRALVSAATTQADNGLSLARQAGDGIAALIAHAQKVSEHIEATHRAVLDQRDETVGIGSAMERIDDATQQNAALVEQAAAAAQSLRDQAQRLSQSVAAFKLS